MTGSRQDQSAVTVSIDGVDYGIWDKRDGGGVDSEETKYKPGGMGKPISLGGNVETDNVTVSRLYDLERDHTVVQTLLSKPGKGRMVVKDQPLDPDGNPFGAPTVWRGVVKTVTPPERDSESSDPAMIEIEMSTEGVPS